MGLMTLAGLEILKARLELYLDCERKLLMGAEEYQIGDRRLRRANLAEVRKAIDDLTEQINALELKHGRIKRIVIMDD